MSMFPHPIANAIMQIDTIAFLLKNKNVAKVATNKIPIGDTPISAMIIPVINASVIGNNGM